MSDHIVVAGGSGLIGTALVEALRTRGDDVTVLTRSGAGPATWDPEGRRVDPAVLEGARAVVCLNGAGIGDKRWSPERKELLRTSRIGPVSTLAEAIATMAGDRPALVASSATGYYGDTGDDVVDESSQPGDDFLAELCVAWEAAAKPAVDAGARVAHPRTGIVLAAHGGALKPLLPIFKAGIGGPIGDGRQWWSWITLEDEVRALLHCIDGDLAGPVNLVSPGAVRQRDFAAALGKQLNRPAVVPAPKFAVNVRLGKELAEAIGYVSQRVAPTALEQDGFAFAHPELGGALSAVFS